ncbi:hypothetical protein ACHHYP_11594 [Achlya hypogyna]|uniref:Uncharacterized protein n=1 Tax=Achlya hypogyna TaxID=1202772 RepID=A0A1V9YIX0_ACHHY|nr:hypothetical protein ACHHYP_11594 [Achlya hypogyna]
MVTDGHTAVDGFACIANTTGAKWVAYPLPSSPTWTLLTETCQQLCDNVLAFAAPTPTTPLVAITCSGDLAGPAVVVRQTPADCLALCVGLELFVLGSDDSVVPRSLGNKLLAGAIGLTVFCAFLAALYRLYLVLRARRLLAFLQRWTKSVVVPVDSMVHDALTWLPLHPKADLQEALQTLEWEREIASWAQAKAEVAFASDVSGPFATAKETLLNELYVQLDTMVEDGVLDEAAFVDVLPRYQNQIRCVLDECDANDNLSRDHLAGLWRTRFETVPVLAQAPAAQQMHADDARGLEDALAYQRSHLLAEIELTWESATTPRRKVAEMTGCVALAELVTGYAQAWAAMNRTVLQTLDACIALLHTAVREGRGRAYMEDIWRDMAELTQPTDAVQDAVITGPLRALQTLPTEAAWGADDTQASVDALAATEASALQAEYEAKMAALTTAQEAELTALRAELARTSTQRLGQAVANLKASAHRALEEKIRAHEAACAKERTSAMRVTEMAAAQVAAAKRRRALQVQQQLQELKAANEAEAKRLNDELAAEREGHQARLLARLDPMAADATENVEAVAALTEEQAELAQHQAALAAQLDRAVQEAATLQAVHDAHARESARIAAELETERAAQQARLDARLAKRRQAAVISIDAGGDESSPEAEAANESLEEEAAIAELKIQQRAVEAALATTTDQLAAAAAATSKLEALHREAKNDSERLQEELAQEQAGHQRRLQARLQTKAAKKTTEVAVETPLTGTEPVATPVTSMQDTAGVDAAKVQAMLEASDADRVRQAQLIAKESDSKHAILMARLEEKRRRRTGHVTEDPQRLAKKIEDIEARKAELRQAEERLAKEVQATTVEAMAAEVAYEKFVANRPAPEAPVSFEKALQDLVAAEDIDVSLEQVQIVEAYSKALEKRYKERQAKKKAAGKVVLEK